MKKKHTLAMMVLVLLLIVGMTTYGEVLEEEEADPYEGDMDLCQAIGLLKGNGLGLTEAYLSQVPKRYQGALLLMRLQGLEETALAYPLSDTYSDQDAMTWIPGRHLLSYLYNNQETIGFRGYVDGSFGPHDPMTAKQYLKVLLIAVGYQEGLDFAWDPQGDLPGVEEKGEAIGLTYLIGKEAFTLKDLGVATVEALKVPLNGTKDSLGEFLVNEGAIDRTVAKAYGLIGISTAAKTQETAILHMLSEKEQTKEWQDNYYRTYESNYYHTYEMEMTVHLSDDKRSYIPETMVETVSMDQAAIYPTETYTIRAEGTFDSEEQAKKDQALIQEKADEAASSAFGEALDTYKPEFSWTATTPVISWQLSEDGDHVVYTIGLPNNLYPFVTVTTTHNDAGRIYVDTVEATRDKPFFNRLHDGVGLPSFEETDQKVGDIIERNDLAYEYFYTCHDTGDTFEIHYFFTAEGDVKGEHIMEKGDFKLWITY